MTTLTISTPSEKQKLFLTARTKHIGFGGARGGGKSWSVRTKAKLLALRFAGIRILIVRRTYPELINNHINILRKELLGIAKYNDKDKVLKFSNGSTINFAYCDNDKDLDRLQGVEYDVIFLDEATQLSEYQMKTITACLRGVNDFPKRVYYTCNPGGQGHGYIKRIFIDKRYEDGEIPEDYSFIQSLATDNKVLMESQPDYVKQLEALPAKVRDAWLYGRWDIYEGQFFEEFRETPDIALCEEAGVSPEEAMKQRRYTHVIEPFEIPRYWTIMCSYDFGYRRPWAMTYYACDPDGTLYYFLEAYGWNGNPNEGNKMTPDEQFKYISDLERQHPLLKGRKIVERVADPAIWDASRGESVAETAARYGIHFTPGDNARINGWVMVRYYLQFDENGYPRMYFFDTCKNAIRTIPLMMFSDTKPEDLESDKSEDHICDTIRYMAMSRPIKPIVPAEKRVIISDPLEQFKTKPI
jgi:phage terminase large subunit